MCSASSSAPTAAKSPRRGLWAMQRVTRAHLTQVQIRTSWDLGLSPARYKLLLGLLARRASLCSSYLSIVLYCTRHAGWVGTDAVLHAYLSTVRGPRKSIKPNTRSSVVWNIDTIFEGLHCTWTLDSRCGGRDCSKFRQTPLWDAVFAWQSVGVHRINVSCDRSRNASDGEEKSVSL
ncbi:hypothetical protein LY76DRAFT_238113 [Colletotrichum caudatum]|nr:hypothetical protein LY76DRAFT_238113 [Colletotrichum caudatum]